MNFIRVIRLWWLQRQIDHLSDLELHYDELVRECFLKMGEVSARKSQLEIEKIFLEKDFV